MKKTGLGPSDPLTCQRAMRKMLKIARAKCICHDNDPCGANRDTMLRMLRDEFGWRVSIKKGTLYLVDPQTGKSADMFEYMLSRDSFGSKKEYDTYCSRVRVASMVLEFTKLLARAQQEELTSEEALSSLHLAMGDYLK